MPASHGFAQFALDFKIAVRGAEPADALVGLAVVVGGHFLRWLILPGGNTEDFDHRLRRGTAEVARSSFAKGSRLRALTR